MTQVTRQISILRRRIIALNRIQATSTSLAVFGAILAAVVLIDYAVRWPIPARACIFILGIVALFRALKRWLCPRWNQTPTTTSLALRIEEVEPSLSGTLASAVDFESNPDNQHDPLTTQIIDRARRGLLSTKPNRRIRRSPAVYAASAAWLVVGIWVVGYFASHETIKIALVRTVLPWVQAEWPPRLLIHSATDATHVARGQTLMLRARANENQDPETARNTTVSAVCVTEQNNGTTNQRILELVPQGDGSWEKPIMAEGKKITIQFQTDDTATTKEEIMVVDAPTIKFARFIIEPPAYALKNRERVELRWSGGTMPNHPAVLAGGSAKIEMEISVPLTPPTGSDGKIDQKWLSYVLSAINTETNTPLEKIIFQSPSPTRWDISWPLEGGVDIVVDPRDSNGIRGQQPLRARIQVLLDQPPTVIVSDPEQDEVVTRSAKIPIMIEARDDLELESIGFRVDRQQRSGESSQKLIQKNEALIAQAESKLGDILELNSMEIQTGDTLLLRGTARDQFEASGEKRETTLGDPRKIRVVDRDVFEQNIRHQTGAFRQNLARVEEGQKETSAETDLNKSIGAQKNISDRIEQAQKTTQRLLARLQRNGLKESNLFESLVEVESHAKNATTNSQNATQMLQEAGLGNQESLSAAKGEQADALNEIQAMLDILDQDNDAAGAQRRIDRVVQEIREQRKELQNFSKTTAGRMSSELSEEDRERQRSLGQKQRATAQEIRSLVEDLHERAEQTKKKDPIQSESYRNAANEGERGDAAKKMEEAADQGENNQTSAAADSMKSAAEAIEKVQKVLAGDQKTKTEELKRRLLSLVQSIRDLVAQAEQGRTQIDSMFDASTDTQSTTRKDAERLVMNISATMDESRSAGRAADSITKILERSYEIENLVVSALRTDPIRIDAAKDGSSRGLELLKKALEKAEEAQQKQLEAENEQDRERLRNKYREFARVETIVRQDVSEIIPPGQQELDRKSSSVSREIAGRQQHLRQQIASLLSQSDVVKGSDVFVKTHNLIDQWIGATHDDLSNSKPTVQTVVTIDLAIGALEALATSLADPEQKDEPFSQNNPEQAGGQGAPGEQRSKIPPIAEIRLVRELQAQINRRTKMIEDAGADSPGSKAELTDLSKLQNDVRVLGEGWVEKMKNASAPPNIQNPTPPTKIGEPSSKGTTPTTTLGSSSPHQPTRDTNQNASQTNQSPPPPTTPQVETPNKQPKTLDELLGIGKSGGEKASQIQRKESLERGLNEQNLRDLAEAAMLDMQLAEKLITQDHDTGLGTQRVQAQVLTRLDALIESAVKFEKSTSSKSSRGQSQKNPSKSESSSQTKPEDETKNSDGQPNSKPSASKSGDDQQNKNASGDGGVPPEPENTNLLGDQNIEEGRSEWGRLPQRIREIMAQSRRDRISALYQKATEAYYRRMAEEPRP